MRRLILFALLISQIAGACNSDDPSATQMASTICHAAQNGLIAPPANSLLASCGLGAKEGATAAARGIANMIKDTAGYVAQKASLYFHPTELWHENVQALSDEWHFFFGSDPARTIDRTAHQDAKSAERVAQPQYSRVEAAGLAAAAALNNLGHLAMLDGTTIACIPWRFKLNYICQFVGQFLTEVFGPMAAGKVVITSAKLARALAQFDIETKSVEELRRLSLRDRMGAASEALKASQTYRTVLRSGNANLLVRKDAISGGDRYFLEEYATVNGKRVKEISEIPRDAKTGGFDSNTPAGARLARMVAGQSQGKYLVFNDVMDLGKTNYFKAGTLAGDQYLAAVGRAMRANMRPGDMMFKNGGDELVVMIDTNDPKAVMSFQQRVHDAIKNDREVQALFRDERVARAQAIDRGSAPSAKQVSDLQDLARTRPGVAMGAARIDGGSPEEAWSSALNRAEGQAGRAKAQAKVNRGGDVKKYNQDVSPTVPRPRYDADIPIYDPVQ